MKRYKQYIGVFLAVVIFMIVGCQKNDVFESSEPGTNQLRFTATLGAAQTATRAGESDNSVLQTASEEGVKPPHIVIHTYTGSPGSSLKPYFSDELGYFRAGNYWDVNSRNVRFLPQGGMNLYGYFATDFADRGDLTNVRYSSPAVATDYPTLTYTAANDDALHQLDLIAAKVENISSPDILIPFRHILSQINFGVKGIDRHQIKVKNIRIDNVYGSGDFDYQSWMWNSGSTVLSYPYYFPDRTERGGGLGDNYDTQGTDDDSKNTYIFGDGGKFGPGKDDSFFYAQIDPSQPNNKYKTVANGSNELHNSLMLIPQEIKKNPNATVTFDYEIKVDGRVIRSGINSVIRLDPYYDWKPNLRYVYLFDFSDPSDKIKFDVLLNPWENWDSDGANTGIKNGTIQQPIATTLNTIGDRETIYLLGLLERNLLWDWSNSSKYTFANLNTLTLDFSGVETRIYSVEVKVPVGFIIEGTNPSPGGKLVITRQPKILLEPTAKQLNTQRNGEVFAFYGTLTDDLTWDWKNVDFSLLKQNESFTLDFSAVNFSGGKTITLQLPVGMSASAGVVSTATSITITNHRVSAVAEPSGDILDVVSDHTVVHVNGGNVGSLGDTWDWSGYPFLNLSPQESFSLVFDGITFNGQSIGISLPDGFRGSTGLVTKPNTYVVTDNGTVTIKNNKINYPTSEQIDALSAGNILALSGERLSGDEPLDWRSYTFPNLVPQASFTFDLTEVDFVQHIDLALPPYFKMSGGTGVNGSNPYIFTQPTRVQFLDNRIPKPSLAQLNSMLNSSTLTISGGKPLPDEVWDWSTVPFTSLGQSGNSFTLDLQNIDFDGGSVDIKLGGLTASGTGVTNISPYVYRMSQNAPITIKDVRTWRSVTNDNPSLTDVTVGQRVVLTGTVSGAQSWAWDQMPDLLAGEWFEIDYSRLYLNGANYLFLPITGGTYSLSGDYQAGWAYLFWQYPGYTNGIVRFTKQ